MIRVTISLRCPGSERLSAVAVLLVREARGSKTSCETADLLRGSGEWSGVLGCAGHSNRADTRQHVTRSHTAGEPAVPPWELTH